MIVYRHVMEYTKETNRMHVEAISELYHILIKHKKLIFIMKNIKVRKLLINYKTLEAFKRFKAYGNQELSMLEDLESNMVENDSKSPFYGIYYGDNLVARMSLY